MEVVVTGTGTEIGKTVVSAVLLARWAGRMGVTYWKPVATGAEEGSDSLEVASLAGPEVRVLKECYRFAPAPFASPGGPHGRSRDRTGTHPLRLPAASGVRGRRSSGGGGDRGPPGAPDRLRVSPGRSADGPGPALRW